MRNDNNVFSVSEINEYIKLRLDSDPVLGNIWIRGEISNFKNQYSTGHLYFSLKDSEGIIKAVMFRSYAQKLKFVPSDGDKVLLHGRISSYTARGEYQIYADEMQPDGAGALALAFERLKAKLMSEGLFDSSHKKIIPRCPERVGIITSASGAAVHDMLNISGRRSPQTEIVIFPALVQGEDAARSLASGIRYFNQKSHVDVIIIGRGGGSAEDLWAFNDEGLARQIYESEIPVVSAVGHETDFTICDFVADMRAPTPSAAAEIVFPDMNGFKNRIQYLKDTANSRICAKLDRIIAKKESLAKSVEMRSPEYVLTEKLMRVSGFSDRLDILMEKRLSNLKNRIGVVSAKLTLSNPLSLLAKRYSVVENQSGEIVRAARELEEGSVVKIVFADGCADAHITALRCSPPKRREPLDFLGNEIQSPTEKIE